MITKRGFKFRVYPNEEQKIYFAKTFGCCRKVWNLMLAKQNWAYENGLKVKLNPADYKEEYPYLKETDSLALCSEYKFLTQAFSNYFNNPKQFSKPKFKCKHDPIKSYTTNMLNSNIKILENGKYIKLPKIEKLRIKMHRSLPEGCFIKRVTVSQTADKYFVSILCEWEIENKVASLDTDKTIAADYSSHNFAVFNQNIDFDIKPFLHMFRKYEEKLAFEQKKLSVKKLHSKNWHRQKTKVDKIHMKISNCRIDFLHKLSANLTKSYDIICFEDINLRNIAQSLSLGKSTNDNGFGMFRSFVEYKADEKGKLVQYVDRFYPSSKLCSVCGYKKVDLLLNDRQWQCPVCNTMHDRDLNAAINIKKEGLRLLNLNTTAGRAGLAFSK